mmetsp:Transcript_6500/g.16497  ORF Transcript_6500/g.16497 Transcript_6500/m.16497 type:complete len:250 (+) Transcript_6500:48-797(+)
MGGPLLAGKGGSLVERLAHARPLDLVERVAELGVRRQLVGQVVAPLLQGCSRSSHIKEIGTALARVDLIIEMLPQVQRKVVDEGHEEEAVELHRDGAREVLAPRRRDPSHQRADDLVRRRHWRERPDRRRQRLLQYVDVVVLLAERVAPIIHNRGLDRALVPGAEPPSSFGLFCGAGIVQGTSSSGHVRLDVLGQVRRRFQGRGHTRRRVRRRGQVPRNKPRHGLQVVATPRHRPIGQLQHIFVVDRRY